MVDQLEALAGNVVVQRLTGDAPRNKLVGPMWSTDKMVILNEIDKLLKILGVSVLIIGTSKILLSYLNFPILYTFIFAGITTLPILLFYFFQ